LEQQAIVANIERETATIDYTISRAQHEIELMREYRTRLISDVVTGQVDVCGIDLPAEASV
jgi:type I restriction enzyme S subunit